MSRRKDKIPISQEAFLQNIALQTRRHFLRKCGLGLGGMALGGLLNSCGQDRSGIDGAQNLDRFLSPKSPHQAGKVKSVIYLHMAGAPSQLELFDYKPLLHKLDGQSCPPSLLEDKQFAFIRGVPKILGPQAEFKQRGESGAWVSDLMPNLASIADELCFLKAVKTDQFNHAPAQLLMQTGHARAGRPSMGAWVTYGLGSENFNLPGFIVLTSGGSNPSAGKHAWSAGFLPTVYQGVHCRSKGAPILFLDNPDGMSRKLREASVDAINAINEEAYETFGDPETLTRIAQYEMAFNMQVEVPKVMDITKEPENILELYGASPGEASFANNVLLARRLVEHGVRFVQLFDWGWDAHGTEKGTAIDLGFRDKCREIDRPITALILDLKQRGLLEETLIVWGGEFGRTPMAENRNGVNMPFKGRDHHPDAFTMWMAGGGLKKGYVHGETDEIGFHAVEGQVSVYDIQATILHLLGLNHEQLTYTFQGRDFRLTDVFGSVIQEILA